MPNKIRRQLDVEWTAEEMEILEKARDLCRKCADDEEMEEWAQENCRESFWDIALGLSDFMGNSI
jgi:hypothetical protein